ncbi:MAG: CPXCG motif-containing cysteine-rich protein [Gammaproteobacteria bacterium]|nr:CPXCG motif-containing cysteine-rich protein [Gammaproteobacteria bacterium]
MNPLETVQIDCPYCGETIELLIDCSIDLQEYIEDCEVCCKPITVSVAVDEHDKLMVVPARENDC